MTDQEKKSGAQAAGGGSPVVMVEQSTASRHKPYRPTDLQDEGPPELHHKRSRAPAVPSVAEELKDSADNADIKDRKDDSAMTSEKHKHIVAKKLSLTTKRRASSPEAMSMTPLEVEVKRADNIITPSSQPIPAQVAPDASLLSQIDKKSAGMKDDEDSITEEIAELRTADPSQKASEWDSENHIQKYVPELQDTEETVPLPRKLANETINNIDNETENRKDASMVGDNEDTVPLQRKQGSGAFNETITSTQELKKKEISWNNDTHLEKVHLQDMNARSTSWMLERKASVGPCYRKTLPYGEPSGITISLPRKSLKNINENINPIKSGISLTISKRCLDGTSKVPTDYDVRSMPDNLDLPRKEKKLEIKIEEDNCANFFENLKGKIDGLRGKIKHVLHM